ncbi:MAG: LacI family DNA-binding transcriptional regulator [Opitutaceae bacterium]|nr:LacI family DNA-binding transcriptional regulator [Opitutaceae bacterium]
MKQRVSMRDLARIAKVSHVTVSKALRNDPKISLATRRRIQELAQKQAYRPDPLLRALAEYRRDRRTRAYQATLAWLDFYPQPHGMDRILDFRQYREGAMARAQELGYKLEIIAPGQSRLGDDALKRILLARGIQGLLLPPQPHDNAVLTHDFAEFTAVTFGFSLKQPQFHLITNHQFHSSALAARVLREYGYRRIALMLTQQTDERSLHNFLGGFLTEQAQWPASHRVPHLVFDEKEGNERDVQPYLPWIRRHKPDAILTSSLPATRDLLNMAGLRIPDDVAMAGTAVPDAGRAGINQNSIEIGRVAVDTLIGMLYRNERGVPAIAHRILIDGYWQDGPTAPDKRREGTG